MSNMSYCRFRNTLADLRDCADAMDGGDDISAEEANARRMLVNLCRALADDYGDTYGDDNEDD